MNCPQCNKKHLKKSTAHLCLSLVEGYEAFHIIGDVASRTLSENYSKESKTARNEADIMRKYYESLRS
jgi:hypothetical protein